MAVAKAVVRLGTRRSQLALWQAHYVRDGLMAAHPGLDVEIIEIVTEGDRRTDAPLSAFGGKGLFLKEIEAALVRGEIDIAVHSMKDVTVEIPQGLIIPVICERADPRDALITRTGNGLESLAPNAVFGTCSLRRRCQLKAWQPAFQMRDLRGNVPTRLQRLLDGDFDAIVLATAGLQRLGLDEHIHEALDTKVCLPAVGQGAVGIECRADDDTVQALISVLNHDTSSICVSAERATNRALGGDCHVPIAAFAELDGEKLHLTAAVGQPDGSIVLMAEDTDTSANSVALGERVAAQLIEQGALDILASVNADS